MPGLFDVLKGAAKAATKTTVGKVTTTAFVITVGGISYKVYQDSQTGDVVGAEVVEKTVAKNDAQGDVRLKMEGLKDADKKVDAENAKAEDDRVAKAAEEAAKQKEAEAKKLEEALKARSEADDAAILAEQAENEENSADDEQNPDGLKDKDADAGDGESDAETEADDDEAGSHAFKGSDGGKGGDETNDEEGGNGTDDDKNNSTDDKKGTETNKTEEGKVGKTETDGNDELAGTDETKKDNDATDSQNDETDEKKEEEAGEKLEEADKEDEEKEDVRQNNTEPKPEKLLKSNQSGNDNQGKGETPGTFQGQTSENIYNNEPGNDNYGDTLGNTVHTGSRSQEDIMRTAREQWKKYFEGASYQYGRVVVTLEDLKLLGAVPLLGWSAIMTGTDWVVSTAASYENSTVRKLVFEGVADNAVDVCEGIGQAANMIGLGEAPLKAESFEIDLGFSLTDSDIKTLKKSASIYDKESDGAGHWKGIGISCSGTAVRIYRKYNQASKEEARTGLLKTFRSQEIADVWNSCYKLTGVAWAVETALTDPQSIVKELHFDITSADKDFKAIGDGIYNALTSGKQLRRDVFSIRVDFKPSLLNGTIAHAVKSANSVTYDVEFEGNRIFVVSGDGVPMLTG